ncbi:hypothetical protein [Bradyrhizobium sp. LTSP857]|uniref:hypothetical protein n=1 Tax=Bradyrhizobium sp. LTSP857 TaxID=1619231 RepID=UPI0005D2C30C|nr:hypothetical protein [Bradyrhizobium sp. LTSP857]KJC37707.1 hypothetical protein UP06_30335 [Bradyrhizobium sp. LTSP857]
MITSYSELIAAINAQREALGVRQQDFDELAGFTPGMTGKAFGPGMVRRLGPEKLFDAMRAAGLAIHLEPDPEQVERMKRRIAENYLPRQANQARPNNRANIDGKTVERVLDFLTQPKKGGILRLKRAVAEYRANAARLGAMTTNRKRRGAAPPCNQPVRTTRLSKYA